MCGRHMYFDRGKAKYCRCSQVLFCLFFSFEEGKILNVLETILRQFRNLM